MKHKHDIIILGWLNLLLILLCIPLFRRVSVARQGNADWLARGRDPAAFSAASNFNFLALLPVYSFLRLCCGDKCCSFSGGGWLNWFRRCCWRVFGWWNRSRHYHRPFAEHSAIPQENSAKWCFDHVVPVWASFHYHSGCNPSIGIRILDEYVIAYA